MTHSASAGFGQNGSTQKRVCGFGSMGRWSAWEIGVTVAAFAVWWPLGFVPLFLKWKNGEMWKGSAEKPVPFAGLKADFDNWSAGWKGQASSYGFAGSGNDAFDAYKREQLKRLDEERRRLEDEQRAFRDFVERLRRAKDQDEFDRFMAERRSVTPASGS